jgi:hypothetical protein
LRQRKASARIAWGFALAIVAAACGGGGGDGGGTTSPPPTPPPATPGVVSTATPYPAGCGLADGTVFLNGEVEPHLAVNPRNALNFVAVWQQDRWSNGGARGNRTAATFDGGASWSYREPPFTRCAGGPFERATDPWASFSPDGTVHQMALAFTGGSFTPGSQNAMLVTRSTDGGLTWSAPVTLITDTAPYFNDKNTLTADPYDARFVYAAWDRLHQTGNGPAWFARSSDGGVTWDLVKAVFDPGGNSQTIGGIVAVLPDSALAYLFTRIDPGAIPALFVMRSTDRGTTWGAPVRVAELLARGARDPETGTDIRDGAILPQMAVTPAGALVVVWQDARFSGGVRDAIALSRSADGGITWSQAVRVNADASVQAFTPQVAVRADGTIGVAYYDLRSNTPSAAELGADYWLARSADGVNWSEVRISGPFNLNTAPFANGLFIGDYMGLASTGTTFLSLHARTTGDAANPTDVYLAPIAASPGRAAPPAEAKRMEGATYAAEAAADFVPDAALRARIAENVARALRLRGRPLPGPAPGAVPR